MILALRTDKPEAELNLLYQDGRVKAEYRWRADRDLGNQLLGTIEDFLKREQTMPDELEGIVVYRGSGSFTGLRIGVTIANALSYSLGISVAGTEGDDWLVEGAKSLENKGSRKYATPLYGAPPHITAAKK